MRFVSIDLETTGLDPLTDQILQVGLCVGDTQTHTLLGSIHWNVLPPKGRVHGDVFAMSMNAGILKEIKEGVNCVPMEKIPETIAKWLVGQFGFSHDKDKRVKIPGTGVDVIPLSPVTVAGKNFGSFDLQFIKATWPAFGELIPIRHRILDVGSLWLEADDLAVPDLKTCLKRAGIMKEVAHNAQEDAEDVARCVLKYLDLCGTWRTVHDRVRDLIGSKDGAVLEDVVAVLGGHDDQNSV